jgi:hypothetical protein
MLLCIALLVHPIVSRKSRGARRHTTASAAGDDDLARGADAIIAAADTVNPRDARSMLQLRSSLESKSRSFVALGRDYDARICAAEALAATPVDETTHTGIDAQSQGSVHLMWSEQTAARPFAGDLWSMGRSRRCGLPALTSRRDDLSDRARVVWISEATGPGAEARNRELEQVVLQMKLDEPRGVDAPGSHTDHKDGKRPRSNCVGGSVVAMI